mmetsp:Transcript_38/g.69  ORF Transcript_38/g.69 Transcript_38/m.69 type:complete len:93 (+) Transcript_38:3-281(+)
MTPQRAASPPQPRAAASAATRDTPSAPYDARRCPATGMIKTVCQCEVCADLPEDATGTLAQQQASALRQRQEREEELDAMIREAQERSLLEQ